MTCEKRELLYNYTLIIDMGPIQSLSSKVSNIGVCGDDITYDDLCPDDGEGDTSFVKIIIGVLVAAVVIAGVCYFIWRRRQQMKKGSLL